MQQDRQISEAIEREQSRLRNFIRRRVANHRDAEDILQDELPEEQREVFLAYGFLGYTGMAFFAWHWLMQLMLR